jgi:hypothetical protein
VVDKKLTGITSKRFGAEGGGCDDPRAASAAPLQNSGAAIASQFRQGCANASVLIHCDHSGLNVQHAILSARGSFNGHSTPTARADGNRGSERLT